MQRLVLVTIALTMLSNMSANARRIAGDLQAFPNAGRSEPSKILVSDNRHDLSYRERAELRRTARALRRPRREAGGQAPQTNSSVNNPNATSSPSGDFAGSM